MPLLLALALLSPWGSAGGSCPPRCVCASNILSCSQAVLSSVPAPLPRFTAVLDLSHNNVSRLRADWLEVLLLYNNEISAVDRTAFDNLSRLRKLYLGQNRIARFPLELLRDGSRLPQLALLDLSANRLRSLPVGELQALPAWLRDRLYLHGNPLACDCPLFQLVEELRCLLPNTQAHVGILALAGRQPLNCSEAREAVLEAHLAAPSPRRWPLTPEPSLACVSQSMSPTGGACATPASFWQGGTRGACHPTGCNPSPTPSWPPRATHNCKQSAPPGSVTPGALAP
uniref:Adhesion molecule with Ig like domain 1 n=1 Tax=Accipiter nisus TaxID=211598 RepID=A0A8B9NNE3_9AVES